jgi:hypothetical protein
MSEKEFNQVAKIMDSYIDHLETQKNKLEKHYVKQKRTPKTANLRGLLLKKMGKYKKPKYEFTIKRAIKKHEKSINNTEQLIEVLEENKKAISEGKVPQQLKYKRLTKTFLGTSIHAYLSGGAGMATALEIGERMGAGLEYTLPVGIALGLGTTGTNNLAGYLAEREKRVVRSNLRFRNQNDISQGIKELKSYVKEMKKRKGRLEKHLEKVQKKNELKRKELAEFYLEHPDLIPGNFWMEPQP